MNSEWDQLGRISAWRFGGLSNIVTGEHDPDTLKLVPAMPVRQDGCRRLGASGRDMKTKKLEVTAKVNYEEPILCEGRYANKFVVLRHEELVHLVCYEVIPPLEALRGESDAVEHAEREGIAARVVQRTVMTQKAAAELCAALSRNLSKS